MNYISIAVILIIAIWSMAGIAALLLCFLFSAYVKNKKVSGGKNNIAASGGQSGIRSLLGRFLHGLSRYVLIRIGKIPSHTVRKAIYMHVFLMRIGEKAVIYGGNEIRAPYGIKIGQGAIIGNDGKLDGRQGIEIGRNANLSTGVWIWTDEHDVQSPLFSSSCQEGKVVIGDRAWLSSRVTILPGVTVGEGAVVAAGAVVTKDIEPFAIYGGVPAKKIGDRNRNLTYEFTGDSLFFY